MDIKIFLNKKMLSVFGIVLLALPFSTYAKTLSCTYSKDSCTNPNSLLFRASDITDAHAELFSENNYDHNVCCEDFENSCTGASITVLNLEDETNAHVEKNTLSNYSTHKACLSDPYNLHKLYIGYQDTDCSGYQTTIASISGETDAHIGDPDSYSLKVCGSAVAQTISFSIDNNTVGFGTILQSEARYATSDASGSDTEVPGHTLTASTTADGGYTIYVAGQTLTDSSSHTIDSIGNTPAAFSPGTEMFGLRAVLHSGDGTILSPFDGGGYSFEESTGIGSEIAADTSNTAGDSVYDIYYGTSISSTTEAGDYGAVVNYTIIGTF